MQPRSTAAPDDIQMSTVFEALKRRAPWLILASAVIGAATFAILSMMAPRYLSEAELAIVAQGSANAFADTRSPSASPDLVTTRMDKEAINTHVKAMQSPELLEQMPLSCISRTGLNSTANSDLSIRLAEFFVSSASAVRKAGRANAIA